MIIGEAKITLFYSVRCNRVDLYKGDEGYIDVILKVENGTADIGITLNDFFDDYYEFEEEDEAETHSLDEAEWVFLREPYMGGPITAVTRINFQSKNELFEAFETRMSYFSDPDFIAELTLGY